MKRKIKKKKIRGVKGKGGLAHKDLTVDKHVQQTKPQFSVFSLISLSEIKS